MNEARCAGVISKRYPYGRPVERGISYSLTEAPEWCPAEGGIVVLRVRKEPHVPRKASRHRHVG